MIFRLVIFLSIFVGFNVIKAGEIFVNQEGYMPLLPKTFYSTAYSDSFSIIEKNSGVVSFQGTMLLRTINDPSTGLLLYSGDFSNLAISGSYYVKTSNGDTSFSFTISDSVYKNLFYSSLKGFYFQRCGSQLFYPNAGIYNRLKCHIGDGFFHSTTGNSGFLSAPGGWHDAGDYGKYVVNAGISVGTLLTAYELFPLNFRYDDLNIPESGNSVPDILDESRYELEWLLKMQAPNGGVYFKLTREQFEAFILPAADNTTRYIYQISSTATGDFSAVMASAYRNYSAFDTAFANKCLAASISAWNYLKTHTSIVPEGGFINPPGTATGEYGDSNDKDERLWSAVELFLSTGASEYHNYYLAHYKDAGLITSSMNWQNVNTLANLIYLMSKNQNTNQSVKNEIKTALLNFSNSLLNKSSLSGLKIILNPSEYNWGSNSDILNKSIILLLSYKLSGNNIYLNSALDQLNYIMGTNAHNLSFVTSIGKNSVMHPHHRPSAADNIVNPVPGLLAGGPDKYLDDPILRAHFNSSTPAALCYIDDVGSYASNEICINWNAPLVFVSGFFYNIDKIFSVKPEKEIIPNGILLEQNYPNPFNPFTTIKFFLSEESSVQLKIFNVNGAEIFNKEFSSLPKGENLMNWNGKDSFGKSVASGVYFLRVMNNKGISDTKKLVLLK